MEPMNFGAVKKGTFRNVLPDDVERYPMTNEEVHKLATILEQEGPISLLEYDHAVRLCKIFPKGYRIGLQLFLNKEELEGSFSIPGEGHGDTKLKDIMLECIEVLKEVADRTGKPLTVLYRTDSEDVKEWLEGQGFTCKGRAYAEYNK